MKNWTLLIFVFLSLNLYSQEKETLYFNYKWKPISEKRAKFRREIIKLNDTLYTVTDYHKSGELYMRGQYSSIRPMVENGFFEFYDFINYKKNATGYYINGVMTGGWTINEYKGANKKINYDLELTNSKKLKDDNPKSDSIYFIVEEMPKFQGSKNPGSFRIYIEQNLIYPPMAVRYSKEGVVYVKFVINSSGQIEDIEVKNTAYKDLEREAVRVISQAPNWTPGFQKGKPVRVQFTFPLHFKLK